MLDEELVIGKFIQLGFKLNGPSEWTVLAGVVQHETRRDDDDDAAAAAVDDSQIGCGSQCSDNTSMNKDIDQGHGDSITDSISTCAHQHHHRHHHHHQCTTVGESTGGGSGARVRCISKVVALGTGTTCMPSSTFAAASGLRYEYVRDSHAEVVARRAFKGYLLKQIEIAEKMEEEGGGGNQCESIFCTLPLSPGGEVGGDGDEDGSLRSDRSASSAPLPRLYRHHLREGVTFSMYISQAPCGHASMHCFLPRSDAVQEAAGAVDAIHDSVAVDDVADAAVAVDDRGAVRKRRKVDDDVVVVGRGHGDYSCQRAILRTKPGRRDAPVSSCLSCSDKLALWCAVGWQGAVIGNLIRGKICVTRFIIGDRFDSRYFDDAVTFRAGRQQQLQQGDITARKSTMRFPFSCDDEVVGSSSNSNNDADAGHLASTAPPPPPIQYHHQVQPSIDQQLQHHHQLQSSIDQQLQHHHQQQPSMMRQKATNLFHSWYEGGNKEVGVGGKRAGAVRLKAGGCSVPITSQSQLSSHNLYRNVQSRRMMLDAADISKCSTDSGSREVVGLDVDVGVGVGSSMNGDCIASDPATAAAAAAVWITMLKKTNLAYQREKARLFLRHGSSSRGGPFESWPSSDPVMAQWRASLYPSSSSSSTTYPSSSSSSSSSSLH